jgi:hypothetical protein
MFQMFNALNCRWQSLARHFNPMEGLQVSQFFTLDFSPTNIS